MVAVKKAKPFLFCLVVVISLLFLYTAYDKKEKTVDLRDLADVLLLKDPGHSLEELNKVFSLSGLGLFSIAMAIGPLSVLFPGVFDEYLWWRKYLGVTGSLFVLIHAIYGIIIPYRLSITKMFLENDKLWGLNAALFSLLVFTAMALTSNTASIGALGFRKWKILHRLGYFALASAVLHIVVMETKASGRIELRPYGWVFLYLPVITLFLKLISVVYKRRKI